MIYDKIFAENPNYNLKDVKKINLVRRWATGYKKVLDVGCGRGHYIKAMPEVNIIGVEPSTYLCEHDLKGLNIVNSDILSYEGRANALYCFDVLEHIPPLEIDDVLKKLTTLAPKALLGIANHSDIWEGTELHCIQEDSGWWVNKLKDYYLSVKIVKPGVRFFVIEAVCSQ